MSATVTVACRERVACIRCKGVGNFPSPFMDDPTRVPCADCDGDGTLPCEADLTVEVDGNREGWSIESVTGTCPHVAALDANVPDWLWDDTHTELIAADEDAADLARAREYGRREDAGTGRELRMEFGNGD